jgi:hypothetical protein
MSGAHSSNPFDDRGANPSPPGPDADRAFLIHWLADRDTPCPQCGYNLRGLMRTSCPECNKALELRVAVADPFLAAWIASAAAVLPAAGIGLIFLLALSIEFSHRGTRAFHDLNHLSPGAYLPLSFAVASVPASAALITLRRRFLRWPTGRQKAAAFTAWVLAAVSLVCVLQDMFR